MALEMMAVGASAVQIGTASFRDPRAPHKLIREMRRYLEKRGLKASDVIGSIRADHLPEEP